VRLLATHTPTHGAPNAGVGADGRATFRTERIEQLLEPCSRVTLQVRMRQTSVVL
jgi:hypothetical protein